MARPLLRTMGKRRRSHAEYFHNLRITHCGYTGRVVDSLDVVRASNGQEIKGQKGVQRPVLSPGTLAPIHPIAFLVITKRQVYGVPVAEELRRIAKGGHLTFEAFGLEEKQLEVTRIEPRATESGHLVDMIGVVTTLEGDPLPAGDIANRLGGFKDIEDLERLPKMAGRAA